MKAEPVAAVLLAAGRSTRMGAGAPKQLLPYGERTSVRRCADALRAGGVVRIAAVIAPRDDLRGAFEGIPVLLVENADPEAGMGVSVQRGLAALEMEDGHVLICLADHPLVRAETIRALVEAARAAPVAVHCPTFAGRRGHPVLFPRGALSGVGKGRTLREARDAWAGGVREVAVGDPGILVDVDTPEDYRRALALAAREGGGNG